MYFDFELDGPPMCPPFTYPAPGVTTARVEARDDELLHAVYVRAAAALGVGVDTVVGEVMGDRGPPPDVGDVIAYVRFAEDGEAADRRANLSATDLEIVDPDGTIRFGRSLDDTTVADLLRTWEAGLVPGDVYRPYFVPYVPGGGIEPWFLSWSTLVGAVSIAGSLLALAANVDGVLGLVERVRRLTRGSAALSDTAVELEARKARPDVLYELLGRRPWAPADLAERLDTSVDNAVALLEVFGFEQAESGLWRRGTSSDAEFLRLLLDEIIVAGGHPAGSTGGGFEERVRYLIENGTRAPMPDWMGGEAGVLEDDDYELEPSDEGAGDEEWPDPAEPIPCGCSDGDCVVTLTMLGGAQTIELVFSAPTEHFVVPSEELTMRAIRLEEGE